MTEKQIEGLCLIMKIRAKEFEKNPEEAKKFLFDCGLTDKQGNTINPYRNNYHGI